MSTINDLKKADIEKHVLRKNGNFPNNPALPLMLYRNILHFEGGEMVSEVENLFNAHNWSNSWHNGIFRFHHYHSNTHEVLGVCKGMAKVQLGGDGGLTTEIGKGDVVIIPAGMAHKNLGSSADFACVGAYPDGRRYDMNYGNEDERPATDRNIADVPLPARDPVYGELGPLHENWYQH